MKYNYKLLIDNKEVDLINGFETSFIYQVEDLSNPTTIKNSFTKNITIEGTNNNNILFGEIYNLERTQLYNYGNNNGVYFDASKRTPFALYLNSTLIESGYMQLTKINVNGNKITYSITLYGGLGDFFYNLMYKDDGEKKTLADLWFNVDYDKENELNFEINKEFVKTSWDKMKLGSTGNTKNDIISFAPSYNGLYENDFDNSTFLINTYNNNVFNNDNNIDGYSTYRGYKLAKVDKEFTEWEVKDLRSYMQRPVIKVSKILNSIFNEANNGGYNVIVDNAFFNSENPYYNKSWLALPMLTNKVTETPEEIKRSDIAQPTQTNNYIGCNTSVSNNFVTNVPIKLAFDGDINTNQSYNIDLSNYPSNSTFNVEVNFNLNVFVEPNNFYINPTDYEEVTYLSTMIVTNGKRTDFLRSILVQLRVYSENDELLYWSNVLNFSNKYSSNGGVVMSTPDKWINYPNEYKEKFNFNNYFGDFKYLENNKYVWQERENKNRTFKLTLNNIPNIGVCKVVLSCEIVGNSNDINMGWDRIVSPYQSVNPQYLPPSQCFYKGYATLSNVIGNAQFKIGATKINSNTTITKRNLLKGDFTPADFLLNYCKMFGLLFEKDINTKTIKITTKNNYYNKGKIVNIDDKINWVNVEITPQLYNTKYFLMKLADSESYYSKKYKDDYSINYGQKRIDTNCNFNQDEKVLFENTIFQNAITVLDTSNYYYSFIDKNGNIAPCWVTQNPTIELYKNVEEGEKETYKKQYNYNDILSNIAVPWNKNKGFDFFPKVCCYTMNKSTKSLADVQGTLLIYNGEVETKDTDNEKIYYWLTDDLEEMFILNGNMCFLQTDSPIDAQNKYIGVRLSRIPQFTRYNIKQSNIIGESFDFGVPKEVYIPNVTYNEDETLFNRYWEKYLTDRYDVNTKKVTCEVNFNEDEITQDMLKNFYFFNNSYWVINKIENKISSSKKQLAKVEFIKVNDINNYTTSQYQYYNDAVTILGDNSVTVDWTCRKYTINIDATNNWVANGNSNKIVVSPSSGTQGNYNIEITLPFFESDITTNLETVFKVNFECMGTTSMFTIKRLPNLKHNKRLYGYVYNEKTTEPLKGGYINISNDGYGSIKWMEAEINENGFFEVYINEDFPDANNNIIDLEFVPNDTNIASFTRTILYNEIDSYKPTNFTY